MNIFGTIRLVLLLLIVIVNCAVSGFIMYTEQQNQCKCGPEWRRTILKYGGFIIASIAILAYFTPVIKIINMIPIIGGFFLLGVFGLCILMIYCMQKYLIDVESSDCKCDKKNELRKMNLILGWMSTTTLIITACVIVFILFYML